MERGTNLVWIDLEMTGLDPKKDAIIEIASIITDSNLHVIEEGPSLVVHQPENILQSMPAVVKEMHTKSGLLAEVKRSTLSLEQANDATLSFIKENCQPGRALLCGNSVWQDRAFLQQYMPTIVSYLNYRIIDVTSVKELAARWYPNDPHIEFKKTDTHRAMADIRESIAELKHYKKYFFI